MGYSHTRFPAKSPGLVPGPRLFSIVCAETPPINQSIYICIDQLRSFEHHHAAMCDTVHAWLNFALVTDTVNNVCDRPAARLAHPHNSKALCFDTGFHFRRASTPV